MAEIRVLYVVGYPRSGSTLMGNVLGESDAFWHAGELQRLIPRLTDGPGARRTLPNRGPGRHCGCGRLVEECEVWDAIVDCAFGSKGGLRSWRWEQPEARLRLYRAIQTVTGAAVVVDSSKDVDSGRTLAGLPQVRASYVHLVRNPKGVVLSRLKKNRPVDRRGRVHLQPSRTVVEALRWKRMNLQALEMLRSVPRDRSRVVPYESFVFEPKNWVVAISSMVGELLGNPAFLQGANVRLSTNHGIAGNRSKFLTGDVRIEEDRKWVNQLRGFDRGVVNILAGALYRRLRRRAATEIRMKSQESYDHEPLKS